MYFIHHLFSCFIKVLPDFLSGTWPQSETVNPVMELVKFRRRSGVSYVLDFDLNMLFAPGIACRNIKIRIAPALVLRHAPTGRLTATVAREPAGHPPRRAPTALHDDAD